MLNLQIIFWCEASPQADLICCICSPRLWRKRTWTTLSSIRKTSTTMLPVKPTTPSGAWWTPASGIDGMSANVQVQLLTLLLFMSGQVDVQYQRMMKRFIPLAELKKYHLQHVKQGGTLKNMALFTRARLSVQPLTAGEYKVEQSTVKMTKLGIVFWCMMTMMMTVFNN